MDLQYGQGLRAMFGRPPFDSNHDVCIICDLLVEKVPYVGLLYMEKIDFL